VSLTSLLALATLLIAAPLNWLVVLMSWRLYRTDPNPVIRDRLIVAVAVAVVVTVFALIFVNNDLVPPIVPFDATKVLTRGVMFTAAVVPPLYWLRLFR
jgi:ABC-type enterochelin transport system permease subunit